MKDSSAGVFFLFCFPLYSALSSGFQSFWEIGNYLIEDPLQVTVCISLNCFQSLCDLLWAFYFTWSSLRFFDSYPHVFDQIWDVFRHFIFIHWHFWVSGFSSSKAGVDEAKRKHTELLTIRQLFCSWSPSSSASFFPFRASCIYFVCNGPGF